MMVTTRTMIVIILAIIRQQFSECTLRVFTTGSDKLNNSMSMFEMFSKTIEVRMVKIITTKI